MAISLKDSISFSETQRARPGRPLELGSVRGKKPMSSMVTLIVTRKSPWKENGKGREQRPRKKRLNNV